MALVNGSSHEASPKTRSTALANGSGMVNLGFQGSNASLTVNGTAQGHTAGVTSAKKRELDDRQRDLVHP